jgi:hypothetical protein
MTNPRRDGDGGRADRHEAAPRAFRASWRPSSRAGEGGRSTGRSTGRSPPAGRRCAASAALSPADASPVVVTCLTIVAHYGARPGPKGSRTGAVGPPQGAGIEHREKGDPERGVLVRDPRVDQLVDAEPGPLSAPHRTGQGPTQARLRAVGPHVLPPGDPSPSCHRHHVPLGLFARRRSADAARVRWCSHPISSSKGTWIAGRFRANHVGR